MRTNLFKSLLVAAMAIGAMGGVKAQDYVTTKDNATDPTKQDVTYTFNDGKKYNSKGVLVDANKVASTYNGSSYTPLYSCTTEGLERLAFNSAAGTSYKTAGSWWWRDSNGLQLRLKSKEGDRTNAIGFLNLKAGNTINIKTKNISGELFSFYGASSINSLDQTPQKEAGEANYTVTYSDNNININVTSDGYVSSFVKSFNLYGYIQSITITEVKPNVVKPEGNITKVDGTKRVISLTSETKGASIYYTTDGSEPTVDSKLLYNTAEGITIDNTTTIKAIAASGDKNSEVYSETFEAGIEVSLATPTFEITNLTEENGVFKPTYKISIDNSNVLCSPKATFSAQFNGEDVANFDGTFNVDTKGNLVVTASANGYTSTSISINVNNYIYSKKVSFDDISESNLTERLGDGWTTAGPTRWASWNQKKGIDKNLNKTDNGEYYTASHSGAFTVDFANFSNGTDLLFGYGFGSSRGDRTATIPNAPKGSMAKYNVCGWGNIELPKYVDYNKGGELPYTIEKNSYALRSIELYLPATETVSVSAAGYATYATKNNVIVPSDVKVMTVKVNAAGTAIELNEVKAGTVIPAKTGILVKAAKGDYNFAVTSKEGPTLENNNLIAATEPVKSDGATFFALTKIGDKVGFAVVNNGVVIPASKAYLSVPAASTAKFFGLDGEATGINSVKTAKADGAYYTLEGVKTTKPVKGIYIHNGKKIVVK